MKQENRLLFWQISCKMQGRNGGEDARCGGVSPDSGAFSHCQRELPGKEKIAFEQFVQGVYFRRILQAANLRLQDMTEGRYLLLHAEKAMNKRSQAGLELEVLDHYTGKSRSVRSLSGGEAFKASLSLALGLSDVIQAHAGGVRVDAMFIDEGFGSLDEQSREQAVQVLQRLSYGNRSWWELFPMFPN